ncbi:hypothetical protein ACQEVX_24845 [Streptomyces syringium]|uniref:hypothetical protein n=1 Tax=Streptomyces syringium TaxID=76729 RepID=UPI003D8ED6AF
MAPRKRTTSPAKPKKCPDCKGEEVTEAVRVGTSRKRRETADHQTALCLTCFGSGIAPDQT